MIQPFSRDRPMVNLLTGVLCSSLMLAVLSTLMVSSQRVLCRPLRSVPPTIPNVTHFSGDLARITWPKSGFMTKTAELDQNLEMSNAELATRAVWRTADAVCFDVDSTVCMDEAIDELAKFVGKEKEVMEMTLKAMRGGMTFREALSRRLDLIQPSTSILKEYLKSHPPHLTPGIKELVTELHDRDIPVYLISGGFRTIIEPVAEQLDIPVKNVFANSLKFYFNGDYAGFDENEPTSHQEGKAEVIAYLKHRFGYRRMIMIGDGATDLTACPPADAFIGFGGNQIREKVKKESKWFVMDFKDLVEDLRQC